MYFNEITSHIAHILDVFMSAQNIRECLGFGYSVLHRGTSLGQLKLLCSFPPNHQNILPLQVNV